MFILIGYIFEKYVGMSFWWGKEEYKILEVVFGRIFNCVVIFEKFCNIMLFNWIKRDFYFVFSLVGFVCFKLRVVLGLSIVVDYGF